jgi:SAM-dependent methyltransferase
MKSQPHDPDHITARALAHNNQPSEDFRVGTCQHGLSQDIAVLLCHIDGEPPFSILDYGCGPGRDLQMFASLGHHPIGLDGAGRFVAMARAATEYEVWPQDFLVLELSSHRFDGSFANASLFHIPNREFPRVLRPFPATLKPSSVLFNHAVSIARAGTDGTARTMSLSRGAGTSRTHTSESWSTLSGPLDCRANSSRGSLVYGEEHSLAYPSASVCEVAWCEGTF